MRRIAWTAAFAAVVLGLAVPRAAMAQDTGANAQPRSGFWFSGGLGAGSLGCDSCPERDWGVILSLGAGGTISQRLAVGASLEGWTDSERRASLTASTLLATLRFYPSATGGFFLRGGLGWGRLESEVSGFGTFSDSGPAALLGLGYDLRITDSVSLTPFLNGVRVAEEMNRNFFELGLGITVH